MDDSSGDIFTSCQSAHSRLDTVAEEVFVASPRMLRKAGANANTRPHTARRAAGAYTASTASSKARMVSSASSVPATVQGDDLLSQSYDKEHISHQKIVCH